MIPLPFLKPPRLIRTPNPDQTTAIRASLARKEREITGLDVKIAEVKDRLATLTNEQEVLNETIKSHEALFSPINQLIPELLQEIFVHCLPVTHNAVMSAQEAPLLLCRVCHSWRQLAYATPYLWSSIHINLDNDSVTGPMPSPDDVNSWLSRSKSLPLSISINGPPGSYSSEVDYFKPYLNAITSVESRWKSFHVSTFTVDVLVHLFSGVDDAGPGSLEELHIDSISLPMQEDESEDDDDSSSDTAFEVFLSLPKLHSLSLPYDAFTPFRSIVDCKKLTHLGITSPTFDSYDLGEIVPVLLSAPHLQSLSISGFRTSFTSGSEFAFSGHAIHLPDLKSLSITKYYRFSRLWALMRTLHTPRLRHWKYDLLEPYYFSEKKRNRDGLRTFLSRLKEPLEELDLSVCSSRTEFYRFLDLLPGLKRLSMDNVQSEGNIIADHYLKGLIEEYSQSDWESESDVSSDSNEDNERPPNATSGYRCPQLEVFKCICRVEFLSENVMLDFLRLRSGSGAKAAQITPLKKVAFLTESYVSDGLQEKVHHLLDGTGTLFQMEHDQYDL